MVAEHKYAKLIQLTGCTNHVMLVGTMMQKKLPSSPYKCYGTPH